jgi:hypothetical protein
LGTADNGSAYSSITLFQLSQQFSHHFHIPSLISRSKAPEQRKALCKGMGWLICMLKLRVRVVGLHEILHLAAPWHGKLSIEDKKILPWHLPQKGARISAPHEAGVRLQVCSSNSI